MRQTVALVLLISAFVLYAHARDMKAVVDFANHNWNCETAACTTRLPAGSWQPDYECAEFVSRSLAAGGFLPGLSDTSPQASYGAYSYGGKTYDMLWVSSKEGGSIGMMDFLIASGWRIVKTNVISAGHVVVVVGSDGPYSHTGIGVGKGLIDAHNAANYKVTSIGSINAVLAPPKGTYNESWVPED